MSSNQNYKTAIIGCGNIGCLYSNLNSKWPCTHLAVYTVNPDTELIALCDVNLNLIKDLAEKNNIKHVFNDYKELLKNTDLDIISICTPDETHYPILKYALENSKVKAIWCEKPFTKTLAQAKEIVQLCKEKNIPLLVNHVRRYDELIQLIKEKREELLGDIQHVVFYYSGGFVTNGSHLFDLLCFLFGKCEKVKGYKTNQGVAAILTFENNLTINVLPCKSEHFSIFEINILSSKARLDIVHKPFWDYNYRYYTIQKDEKSKLKRLVKNKKELINKNLPKVMETALQDLISCINSNKEPISSGKESMQSLEIILAIDYSINNNSQEVILPFTDLNAIIPKAVSEMKK